MSRRAVASIVAVAVALFVDSLLYSLVVPILPALGRRLDLSSAEIGVLFAVYAIGLLAATPPFGVVSDRIGRRAPLLAGAAGITIATLLFTVATTFPLLLAARLMQGIAAAAVWTAGVALIAETVPERKLGRSMGAAMTAMSAGLILGPPLGGLLVDAAGRHAPFLVAAALAAASGVAQLVLVRDTSATTSARLSVCELLADVRLRWVVVAVLLAAATLSMLEPVLPLDMAGRIGAGAGTIGLVFGAATLAHGLAGPAVGALADRCPREPLIGGGLIGMGLLVPLVAVAPSAVAVAVILAGVAVAFTFVLVPALPALADAVERRRTRAYATAYGLFNLAYGAGMVLGPAAGGAAASAWSVPVAISGAGAVACGGGLLIVLAAFVSGPTHRQLRSST